MSFGTEILYNGVLMRGVLTKQFLQEAVYDEASRTDKVYDRFTVHVAGQVHVQGGIQSLSGFEQGIKAVGVVNYTPEQIAFYEQEVRRRLQEPRKIFLMTVNGNTLLRAEPAEPGNRYQPITPSFSLEVNNGPKPGRLTINKITPYLFAVEWEIEICLVDCLDSNNPSGVLSNRWSLEDTFDEDWRIHRRLAGSLRIARLDIDAQAFRNTVTPPLNDGFRITSMQFISSTDGLRLDYVVSSVTEHAAPPSPAKRWKVSHSETTSEGYNVFSAINARVWGEPGGNKKALAAIAFNIARIRLGINPGGAARGDYRIVEVMAAEPLEDNVFDVRITIQRTQNIEQAGKGYFATVGQLLGSTLEGKIDGYDPKLNPIPSENELPTPVGLFICRLQTPCNADHAFAESSANQSNTPRQQRGTGPTYEYGEADLPDYPAPGWSSDHKTAMYTFYKMSHRYVTNKRKAHVQRAAFNAIFPGSAAQFFAKSLPLSRLILMVDVERNMDWPKLPQPRDFQDLTGPAVLLDYFVQPPAVVLNPDGSSNSYRLHAEYVYGLSAEPSESQFRVPQVPWLDASHQTTTIPSTVFDGGVR